MRILQVLLVSPYLDARVEDAADVAADEGLDVNVVRLVLFNAAAIAVAIAVLRLHSPVSRGLLLAGALPVIAANAWALAWVLLAIGRDRPFAGDFGLVGFYAGLSVWLADAWFGLVSARVGPVWRWSGRILAVGSLLAATGIDRLELTTSVHPTIFGPLSLLGIAMNGLGLILLGLELLGVSPRHEWRNEPDRPRA